MDQPYTIYPEGIGASILFVYTAALRPPLYKQLVGVNPEPPIIRHRGINGGSTAAAEREDN